MARTPFFTPTSFTLPGLAAKSATGLAKKLFGRPTPVSSLTPIQSIQQTQRPSSQAVTTPQTVAPPQPIQPKPITKLGVSSSIVDFLRARNQLFDFNTRAKMFRDAGLESTLGSFVGSATQNTALLKQLQAQEQKAATPAQPQPQGTQPPSPTPIAPPAEFPTGETATERLGRVTGEIAPEFAGQFKQAQEDVTGELARGEEKLRREVGEIKTASAEELARLPETVNLQRQEAIGNLALRNLSQSGFRLSAEEAIAKAETLARERIPKETRAKIFDKLEAAESKFGTDFLRNLGIPEADSFAALPATVRGTLLKEFSRQTESIREKMLGEIRKTIGAEEEREFDLAKLAIDIPEGQSVQVGSKLVQGVKSTTPKVKTIQSTDAQGNVTVVGISDTGEKLYELSLGRIGKGFKATSASVGQGSQIAKSLADSFESGVFNSISEIPIGQRGAVAEELRNRGVSLLTVKQREAQAKLSSAENIFEQIKDISKRVNIIEFGPEARARGAVRIAAAAAGLDNDVRLMRRQIAFLGNLARGLGGEVGVLTDRDIDRINAIMPKPTDSKSEALDAINEIQAIFDGAKQRQVSALKAAQKSVLLAPKEIQIEQEPEEIEEETESILEE